MTVDQNKEQIDRYIVCSDQTMATTSTFKPTNHFKTGSTSLENSSLDSSSEESLELSTRLKGLDLKERLPNSGQNNIPRRQPTIVCEDIADDIDFDDEEYVTEESIGQESTQTKPGVTRSASTASLTVPQSPEGCDEQKRRPPLPGEEHMLIESN